MRLDVFRRYSSEIRYGTAFGWGGLDFDHGLDRTPKIVPILPQLREYVWAGRFLGSQPPFRVLYEFGA